MAIFRAVDHGDESRVEASGQTVASTRSTSRRCWTVLDQMFENVASPIKVMMVQLL